MMTSISNKKTLFAIGTIISLVGYSYFVYAAAPSGGYTPGQTLNPDCAPGDTDCFVNLPSGGGSSVTADNGLTLTGSNVQLGGSLLKDTKIDVNGNQFGIVMDEGGPTETGYFAAQFSGSNYAVISGKSLVGDTSMGIIANSSDVGSFISFEDALTSDHLSVDVNQQGIHMFVIPGSGSDGNDYFGIAVDRLGGNALKVQSNSGSAGQGINTAWTNFISTGNIINLAALSTEGNWTWSNYQNNRNDTGSGSPINFLYTDAGGNILSSPISALGGGGSGSGWSLTGDAGTDGGTTNFLGTTDAQDLVLKVNEIEIGRFGQNGNVALGNYTDGSIVGMDSNGNTGVTASGIGSMAWGGSLGSYDYPLASGDLATAWGVSTVASSYFATAFGDRTKATQENATAFGTSTWASGTDSTAWGQNTQASGSASTAFGQENMASGSASTVWGKHNFARSVSETAFGLNGTDYTPLDSTYGFNAYDRLLSIGNGSSFGDKHNAYTLWKDGSFAYNDDNFQNDDPGTEQNMFYFNYGNHDGLGAAQTKRAIRLGSAVNDEWDINSANVGNRSVAIGFGDPGLSWDAPIAIGVGSLAFGVGARAEGDRSTALGYFNKATGLQAFAAGSGAEATEYASVSIGYGSIASGVGSFAANGSTSSGSGSSSFNASQSTNSNSFAANRGHADGEYSAAFGQNTLAVGYNSFVVGGGSTANGNNSFAGGNNSTANGTGSFSFGSNSKAFSQYEIAFGDENTTYIPTDTNADRLFVLGNGSESDAFTILKNGQTGIAIDNFEANTNGNIFQIGDGATGIIAYVDSGTGAWVPVSDERKKTNIMDLSYNLETLMQLRPVSFDYKRNGEHTVGFLAQQVQGIVPESVFGDEDKGYGMAYDRLVPLTVKAIQEMNLNVTNLSDTTRPNTWRDSLIAWFGNVSNGIQDIFAKRFVATDELCVDSECFNANDIRQLKSLIPVSNNQTSPVITPPNDPGTEPDIVDVPVIDTETSSDDSTTTDPVIDTSSPESIVE